jgi:hypothetical protein
MARRPRAVRLALPATIVAILTFVALWRVTSPTAPAVTGAPSAVESLAPLTQIAEMLASNSIGRQASLENVTIREVVSARALWIGEDDHRVFVVLDPDVRNPAGVPVRPGTHATLVGLVRAAPSEDEAIRQWAVDTATAKALHDRGTYLHVTEIRPQR